MQEKIKILLNRLKISQKELADQLGVSKSTINAVATGKNKTLSADALKSARKILNVNLNWLLSDDPNEPMLELPNIEAHDTSEMSRDELIEVIRTLEKEIVCLQVGYANESVAAALTARLKDLPVAKAKLVKQALKLYEKADRLVEELRNSD